MKIQRKYIDTFATTYQKKHDIELRILLRQLQFSLESLMHCVEVYQKKNGWEADYESVGPFPPAPIPNTYTRGE